MGVAETIFEEMKRRGIPSAGVRITTNVEEYIDLYRRYWGIDDAVLRIYRESLLLAGEECLELPSGERAIFVVENADWFTVQHIVAHLYVDRVLGIRLYSAVRYMSLCKEDPRYLAIMMGNIARNLLDDVLADLAFKKVVGEEYWEGAVKEMEKTYRLLERPENALTMGYELQSWMLHVIEAVYYGQATSREAEAIKNYLENPNAETGIKLVDTLVKIGRDVFGIDVTTSLKMDSRPVKYILVLSVAYMC